MPSDRTWQQRFRDMLEAAYRIVGYSQGMTYEELIEDRRTFDAVLFNLAVIGDAANNVPDEIQSSLPDVPWSDIVGIRIVIVHRYFHISEALIWDAATLHIPPLIRHLENYLTSTNTP